jgi:hypothetical protein
LTRWHVKKAGRKCAGRNAGDLVAGCFHLLLFLFLLFAAGASQYPDHTVIPLMARGIEDHVLVVRAFAHLDENGPGTRPRLRILKRNLALQVVGVETGDALRHLVGIGIRSPESLREVRGLHHERVAFPMAA